MRTKHSDTDRPHERQNAHSDMRTARGATGKEAAMMRGRKFSAEDLQLILLALIGEQARHGYELIKEIEIRTNGYYVPSPGVIYPALTYLEEIDHTTVETHGNRKRYHLAAAGRDYLDNQREYVERLLAGLRHVARKMAWMKQAWQNNPEAQEEAVKASGWSREYIEARYALREALFKRSEADYTEQRRIVDILERATAEILGTAPKSCGRATTDSA